MNHKNEKYAKRVRLLQSQLIENETDYYILADADPHGSEYVCDYYKLRTAFSGFTGSNGTLLVGQEGAWLWTDGRYFIQAEKELDGTGIELMRMGEPDVPSLSEFLAERGKEEASVECDGKCLSMSLRRDINNAFDRHHKECVFIYNGINVRQILKECGESAYDELKGKPIRVLPESLGGVLNTKLLMVRGLMQREGCEIYVSMKLDTNMWLLNIRGEDIQYCPVAFSYVIITEKSVHLFVRKEAITPELERYAATEKIILEDYDCFYEMLGLFITHKNVLVDFSTFNALGVDLIFKGVSYPCDKGGELSLFQAIKLPHEIRLIKDIYVKDSAAVCKFLYWLSLQGPGKITEYEAACKMDALRAEIPENRGLSFDTISAFGSNAAMMHYSVDATNCATLEANNLYLLDSGGQYDGGTTDVTRTVIIGEPTEEMRKHYTMVVRGMLALQNAVFIKGCTGINLDILAREPMWEEGMDYKCGTGHGIGYMLNVHEGPHGIRTGARTYGKDAEILPGMLVSDEPGIYLKGKYGIRMENILLCEEKCRTADGTFLCFYPLTYVPVDMRLIEKSAMTEKEFKQLTDYQKEVYDKVAPFLTQEERVWLKKETE